MENDSHRKKCQSEAPRRSQFSSRHNGESSSVSYSRSPYTPSRLSQVTNAGDISDVDVQTEALSNLSFASGQQQAVPVTIDTISAWVKQGGSLEALDDGTMAMLLSQYLGLKGERSRRCRCQAPKVVPPPAPILEEEEEQVEGGALDEPPSSPSRRKDRGKDRAR
ncbi:hypothetical protein NHJ13051_004679 [Beauveria bassiana]